MINQIIELSLNNGGITWNPLTGEINPETGYIVSLNGHESKAFGLNKDMLLHYISHKRAHLSEDIYIGLWKDNDEWYYDLSIKVMDKLIAEKIAVINNQKAYWDCANKTAITTLQVN